MAQDREREIRFQFLEEAAEHLDRIESGLLGISTNGLKNRVGLSRAAHSLKGGAAMMGFDVLSYFAGYLEDFFKVLPAKPESEDLERLLLESIDSLRQVVECYQQGTAIEENWLEGVKTLFNQLRDRLGPELEDTRRSSGSDGEETEPDIIGFLFETEVEECLQRLESVLANSDPCLLEEFALAAQELGGLGEMLDLPAWGGLCQSIERHLEAQIEPTEVVARLAVAEWRRTQTLILANQFDALPSQLTLESGAQVGQAENQALQAAAQTPDFLQEHSLEEAELFSAIEALSSPEADAEEWSVPAEASIEDQSSSLVPVVQSRLALAEDRPQLQQFELLPPTADETQITIRVSAKQLEQLGDRFGGLNIERNSLQEQLKHLRSLVSHLAQKVQHLDQVNYHLRNAYDRSVTESAPTSASQRAAGASNLSKASASAFDRLEMDYYSDLHPLFQEVIETVVQLQEVKNDLNIGLDEAQRTASDLGRTAKLLRNSIIQMRMRPFSDLAGRFTRAVRDMSLKSPKKAELKLKGGSTLIDRTVLEALNEPLLHLIRNAFAHGIEDPETRLARGKPELGTIEIRAVYRGNQTAITLHDDGEGINLDKIRAKALAMGFAPEDLERASDRDLLELIFEPGFSTTEQVTELSGRGVGMDIVRNCLQQVRGDIEVNTKPGLGTTFTITVPLTLSVLRVLVVESNGVLLAFPTNAIEEVLLLKPDMLLAAEQEVLEWRGCMVPLIRLEHWLKFSRFYPQVKTEAVSSVSGPTLLIIPQGEEFVALGVNRFRGEQEATIRPVEGLKMPSGIIGCTILENGQAVPLVDTLSLLRSLERSTTADGNQSALVQSPLLQSLSAPASRMSEQKTVLAIDDSTAVRRFLAFTLEQSGYRVEQAQNGQDGWEKLHSGISVQAVVCDIEMPLLDGYGFLSQLKSDPVHKDLPVVMLTSRSNDKHRQLAMKLGATAYISKPFKEQDLLQILAQL